MKEFIKTNGTPDFIWEFRLPKHRYGMRLYYVDRDIVALLIQKDRSPDSIIVQNERPLTEFERLIYSKLTEQRSETDGEPIGIGIGSKSTE